MLSILILTHNEEHDLPGCLEDLKWCDDLIVYDSYSTDLTEIIATSSGARLVRRPGQDLSMSFGGDEASHRNWALREITFKYPWLLVLDADERLSPEAYYEIHHLLSAEYLEQLDLPPNPPVAFQLRRRDFFHGRQLKHVQVTPWYIRLFRPEFVHYERLVNPVTIVNGTVASIQGCINHFPFSKGLSHWLERHNTYSTLEARQLVSSSLTINFPTIYKAVLSPSFSERRFHQKILFSLLPFRPIVKFVWLYFLKRGLLDGGPGLTYALLQSIYEFYIVLKIKELKHSLQAPDS